jgi:hypothetical protein
MYRAKYKKKMSTRRGLGRNMRCLPTLMFQLIMSGQYTPHLKYFNKANTKTGLYLLSLSERAKNKETFKNSIAGFGHYFSGSL